MLSQIPNLLTLLRIIACPVLVLLLSGGAHELALALFLFAGATDGLDGYIAKRYHYTSTFGAILDPVADKLLIASAYIMLSALGGIPFWLVVAVMFRDLVIVGGYLVLAMMGEEVPMKPSYTSKVNTFMQISLVVAVLAERAEWLHIPGLFNVLVAGVLLTTVLSGGQYVWAWGIRRDDGAREK